MLRNNHILYILLVFFCIASCQPGKHKVRKSKKKSYTTLEDSDFLFNEESKLSLKQQYKLYKKKKKELSQYQPENTEENLHKNNNQKGMNKPKTYY